MFHIQEIKVEEEGEVGEVEMLLQSPPRAQIKKPHFTVKNHLHPAGSTASGYFLGSFHCLLDVSAKEIFQSLCRNGKNPTVQS